MKKLLCLLLALLPLLGAAETAENPFAPYVLTAPEGCELQQRDGTYAFVSGTTRVVAIRIDRIPDEDPATALPRLMGQFDPQAVIGEEIITESGFYALQALHMDADESGIDQRIVMVLLNDGTLLILSGCDLNDDAVPVVQLMDALLATLTANGAPALPANEP